MLAGLVERQEDTLDTQSLPDSGGTRERAARAHTADHTMASAPVASVPVASALDAIREGIPVALVGLMRRQMIQQPVDEWSALILVAHPAMRESAPPILTTWGLAEQWVAEASAAGQEKAMLSLAPLLAPGASSQANYPD